MCNSKFAAMCRFNPIENSATLTASFAKRAGMVGTAEYNYLVSLRKSNPGLVVLKATHASPTPKTDEEGKVKPRDPFAKVSYKAMEDYMSQCRTKDAYQKEFNNIRLLSKGQPVYYYCPSSILNALGDQAEEIARLVAQVMAERQEAEKKDDEL